VNSLSDFSVFGSEVNVSMADADHLPPTTSPDPVLPLVIRPTGGSLDIFGWIEEHKQSVKETLSSVGAILFRDFPFKGNGDFIRFGESFIEQWLPYVDRASKRSPISGPVFSSTDTPPRFDIPLHNESSFTSRWPETVFFYCHIASKEGGRTPIVDVRSVYEQLDPAVRDRVEQHGVLYVRNFGQATGMDWKETFQVNDRNELEGFCTSSSIALEWLKEDRLRTYQIRPGVVEHPVSGKKIWFNHALALHYTSLDKALQETFLRQYGQLNLPHNTYYGDGSAFRVEEMQHIREVYHANSFSFDWQPGDLLVLDNMSIGHGREPYRGERKVVVSMADPMAWDAIGRTMTSPNVEQLFDVLVRNTAEDDQTLQSQMSHPPIGLTPIATDSVTDSNGKNYFLKVVAEELELDAVHLDDVFEDLGGDSMAAAIIIETVLEDTGIELPVDDFFSGQSLAHLASILARDLDSLRE